MEELFDEWLKRTEKDVLALLRKEGPMSAAQIAAALKLSGKGILSIIHKMAQQGTIKITEIQVTT